MYFLASRAKARLNWLNRLRSAKGFPADPGLEIDDFLNSSASSSSQDQSPSPALSEKAVAKNGSVKAEIGEDGVHLQANGGYGSHGGGGGRRKPRAKKKKTLSAVKAETEEWLDITNDALAELFCMREESTCGKKQQRRGRKQEKPRLCPSSNLTSSSPPPLSADDNSVENNHAVKASPPLTDDVLLTSSPLSAVNSVVTGAGKKHDERKSGEVSPVEKRKGFRQMLVDDDNGKGKGTPPRAQNADISSSSSHSYAEVTLIDTSIPALKFRKVIYRKGAVWKVRDKKAPSSGAQSGADKCSADVGKRRSVVGVEVESGLHRSKRKGLKSAAAASPNSRTVDDSAAECSSVKIHTRRAHSDYTSSSKDTYGHGEVRTEVEEHKDNIPNTRNSRKRQLNSGSMDYSENGTLAEDKRLATEESLEALPQSSLSPDHPVNQPIETLLFSLYQVFLQAGKTGLTAREAVSRILERGLPGLHEGGVVPRVEVAKIIRTSPYFMQLDESKFVLCSAIIGTDLCPPINLLESTEEIITDETLDGK